MAGREPIRVEVYRCPVCSVFLHCRLDEAKEHTEIPEDEPFLPGFVFVHSCSEQEVYFAYVIERTGRIAKNIKGEGVHGYHQDLHVYDLAEDKLRQMHTINSRILKRKLIEGEFRTADDKELEKLRSLEFRSESGLLELVSYLPQ
jgi:hypothetical protein